MGSGSKFHLGSAIFCIMVAIFTHVKSYYILIMGSVQTNTDGCRLLSLNLMEIGVLQEVLEGHKLSVLLKKKISPPEVSTLLNCGSVFTVESLFSIFESTLKDIIICTCSFQNTSSLATFMDVPWFSALIKTGCSALPIYMYPNGLLNSLLVFPLCHTDSSPNNTNWG